MYQCCKIPPSLQVLYPNLSRCSAESLLDSQRGSGFVDSGVRWSASCVYFECSKNGGFQEKINNTFVLAEPFVRLVFHNL